MWLSACRIARDAGDISSLFPPGIDSLLDLPYTIFNAIQVGLYFASFDELLREERPPKAIWFNESKMEEWWEGVEKMREEKMKGQDTSGMTKNALVDEILVGG